MGIGVRNSHGSHLHMSFTHEQSVTVAPSSLNCFFLCGKAAQASLHDWFLDHFSGNLLFFSHLYNTTCPSSSLAPLWRSWVSTDQQRNGLQRGQKVPMEGKGDQRMELCLLEEEMQERKRENWWNTQAQRQEESKGN